MKQGKLLSQQCCRLPGGDHLVPRDLQCRTKNPRTKTKTFGTNSQNRGKNRFRYQWTELHGYTLTEHETFGELNKLDIG